MSLFDGEVNQYHAGMWRNSTRASFLHALLTDGHDGRSDTTGVPGSRQRNLGYRVEPRRCRAGITLSSFRDAITPTDNSSVQATASGDSTVRLWDSTTQTCIGVLRGHGSSVRNVSWDPFNPSKLTSVPIPPR